MLTAFEKASIYKAHLETPRLLLKPFSLQHRQKYARWFTEDTALCAETATDYSSENFDATFCQTMQEDADKLLFILLDKVKIELGASESDAMIGDIGCHFIEATHREDEKEQFIHDKSTKIVSELQNVYDSSETLSSPKEQNAYAVEITLMIAEPRYRRQGLAYEVANYFIQYVLPHFLPIPSPRFPYFIAKINRSNEPSLSLFKKLNFKIYKELPIFDELWLIQ